MQRERDLKSTITQDPESGVIRGGRHQKIFGLFSPILLEAFTLTFLAEWGDRSQMTTIVLAAREVRDRSLVQLAWQKLNTLRNSISCLSIWLSYCKNHASSLFHECSTCMCVWMVWGGWGGGGVDGLLRVHILLPSSVSYLHVHVCTCFSLIELLWMKRLIESSLHVHWQLHLVI